VDPDADLAVLGDRRLDVFQPQDLGRPVPVVDDGSHEPHCTAAAPLRVKTAVQILAKLHRQHSHETVG
jgi:hypothetical protein